MKLALPLLILALLLRASTVSAQDQPNSVSHETNEIPMRAAEKGGEPLIAQSTGENPELVEKESLQPIHYVIIFLCISLAIGVLLWMSSSTRRRLDEWARENGYNLVSAKFPRLGDRGPYRGNLAEHHWVYRIKVTTSDGTPKSGWALCGAFKVVDITWDNEVAEP
jgi:hypothetical protein